MVLAVIIAVTLIAVYVAVLVGLYRPGPEGQVQALNYPVTFVHNPGESWAVRDEGDHCLRCGLTEDLCRCAFFHYPFPAEDPNHTAALEGGYP